MEAAMPPDHAPVPGNGTATNNMSPSHWNSCIGLLFVLCSQRSCSQAISLLYFSMPQTPRAARSTRIQLELAACSCAYQPAHGISS
jgi:hypothetical protein